MPHRGIELHDVHAERPVPVQGNDLGFGLGQLRADSRTAVRPPWCRILPS